MPIEMSIPKGRWQFPNSLSVFVQEVHLEGRSSFILNASSSENGFSLRAELESSWMSCTRLYGGELEPRAVFFVEF